MHMRFSARNAAVRGAVAALVMAFVSTSAASAQTLGYILIPTVQRIQWDDNLAFKDDYMYGGRLALQFGPLVELQPFYFTRGGKYPIDGDRAAASFGPNAEGRTTELEHFGASVQVNFGDAGIVPFARAGGGILRFTPDSGERRDRVALTAGGGLRFGVGRLRAELFAEQQTFRLDPMNLFGTTDMNGNGNGSDNADRPRQRNLVYGAALTIPFSTMPDPDENTGLRGATAPIEAFVGQLRFDDGLGLERQNVAGVRAGVDFSPLVGVRGFYWRGVNDDRDATVPIVGYGGEARFNLNSGVGVSPYLILGAGRIQFLNEFRDTAGNQRRNQTPLIAGGGISFQLAERFSIDIAARDHIITADDEFGDVLTTDDLTHNWMYTAGISIGIGGRTGDSNRERARDRELRELRDEMRDRERTRDMMTARERAREDERDRELRELRELRSERLARGRDSLRTMPMMMGPDGRAMPRPGPGEQWALIPIPTQGEVILRYGVTTRDSVAVRSETSAAAGDIGRQLADLERRLTDRIDAMRQGGQPTTVITTPGAPGATPQYITTRGDTVITGTGSVFNRFGQIGASSLQPAIGFGGGDDRGGFMTSLRADLGPMNPGSRLHYAPELALGFGSGSPTILAMMNVKLPFGSIGGNTGLRPYVTGGAGIYSPTVLGINTAVGTSFDIPRTGRNPLSLFAEVQGINLFNHTRFMVGLSSRR